MWAWQPRRQQPDAANDDGQQRRCRQQHPMRVVPAAGVTGCVKDNCGEDGHGGHRAGAERRDVSDRFGARRKSESRNHAKEVRAARNAVQDAQAE